MQLQSKIFNQVRIGTYHPKMVCSCFCTLGRYVRQQQLDIGYKVRKAFDAQL
jgi:hypothetical protein